MDMPLVKAVVVIVGILLIIGSIGVYFLGMMIPQDVVAGTLAGYAVGMFIVGIIVLIIGKKIELNDESNVSSKHGSYFQCEYCKMSFEKEVEKINHYLECETRKNEEPNKDIDKN